jgi:diguanylate cyclase (GGDEF)-like protein/PAS domain S-box-containing protein
MVSERIENGEKNPRSNGGFKELFSSLRDLRNRHAPARFFMSPSSLNFRLDRNAARSEATSTPDFSPVHALQRQIDEAFTGYNSAAAGGPSAYLLRETLENITQGVIMFDARHRIRLWNQRALDLLELPFELFAGNPTIDEVIAYQASLGEFVGDADINVRVLRAADHTRQPTTIERRRPNGRIIKIATTPMKMGGFVRTFTDVTLARQQQAKLIEAEREFRELYENATIGIYRTSVDGRQVWANPALVALNGYRTEAEMLAAVNDIAAEWYVDPTRRREFVDAMLSTGSVTNFESEIYRHATREKIWISENAWVVRDGEGKVVFFEGTVLDITARKRAVDDLAYLARHDTLTGLLNRHAFIQALEACADKTIEPNLAAVICIDLDGFKTVNDTFGHSAGDLVLKAVASRLKSILPPGATLARLGGDEFAALVCSMSSVAELGALAGSIVSGISSPFRISGHAYMVGASVGVAVGGRDGSTPEEVLRAADSALYLAKNSGKCTYAFFNGTPNLDALRQRTLEFDLRGALQNDGLTVVYQPIVTLKTGKPVGREALVRWTHPTLGPISPAEFIPMAERCGVIHPLESFVLDRVCNEISRLDDGLPVSVNISPSEFVSDTFYSRLVSVLRASGLAPSRLEIEITEGVILSDNPHVRDVLERIRALGVKVVLDDFGSGYSSLIYLQKFNFDKIKIDQYFLRNRNSSGIDKAILKAIIGLGKDIGCEIVVEGVETEAERDMLCALGCAYGQGYFFGRPAPLAPDHSAGSASKA